MEDMAWLYPLAAALGVALLGFAILFGRRITKDRAEDARGQEQTDAGTRDVYRDAERERRRDELER